MPEPVLPRGWSRMRLADAKPMPWRNGGGTTRELVAWPDAADWAWRMSVAEVASDGPFSRFDGVTRWFAVLRGAGVNLEVDGIAHRLDRSCPPLCFDGGLPTACTLIDGATQDFNLMLRDGRAQALMRRVAGRHRHTAPVARLVAVYVAQGPCRATLDHDALELEDGALAWGPVGAGVELTLEVPDALWMEIEA